MRSLIATPIFYLLFLALIGLWLFGQLPVQPPEWLTDGPETDPIISSPDMARPFYLLTLTLVSSTLVVWFATSVMRRRLPVFDLLHMVRVVIVSRQGFVTLVISAIYLAMTTFWVVSAGAPLDSYFMRINVTVVAGNFLLILLPPSVIVLANSSSASGRLLETVVRNSLPLRVVSLLDGKHIGRIMFENKLDNLRTIAPEHWRGTVHRLVDTTPLVIVDARVPTPPLCEEIEHMLAPERIGRAVFVLDQNGGENALDEVDPEWHQRKPVWCYTNELPRVLASFKRTGTVYPLMFESLFRWYPMQCHACGKTLKLFLHRRFGLVIIHLKGRLLGLARSRVIDEIKYCQRCKQCFCRECAQADRACACTEGPEWGTTIALAE